MRMDQGVLAAHPVKVLTLGFRFSIVARPNHSCLVKGGTEYETPFKGVDKRILFIAVLSQLHPIVIRQWIHPCTNLPVCAEVDRKVILTHLF
jgi:hypothetical protein